MNERIRELLSQADIKFDKDIDEIDVCVMLPSSLEKFAELIVRECVAVCRAQRDPQHLNYKPTETFSQAIESHFGVKS